MANKAIKSVPPRPSRLPRRADRTILLDKLKEFSEKGERLVPNAILREALGWDDVKYLRIRSQLITEEILIVGRGRGGSVGLATAPGSKALSVFVAYSHFDKAFKEELVMHLEPLKKLGLMRAWHDQLIKPGDEWDKVISAHLDDADIILLLISIHFINSKYCYDVELDKAMEHHAAGRAIVIPVIARNCLWQLTPFSKLQAVPEGGKAINSWGDREEAYVSIANAIKKVAEDLMSK